MQLPFISGVEVWVSRNMCRWQAPPHQAHPVSHHRCYLYCCSLKYPKSVMMEGRSTLTSGLQKNILRISAVDFPVWTMARRESTQNISAHIVRITSGIDCIVNKVSIIVKLFERRILDQQILERKLGIAMQKQTGEEIELNTGKTYVALVPSDSWNNVVIR